MERVREGDGEREGERGESGGDGEREGEREGERDVLPTLPVTNFCTRLKHFFLYTYHNISAIGQEETLHDGSCDCQPLKKQPFILLALPGKPEAAICANMALMMVN